VSNKRRRCLIGLCVLFGSLYDTGAHLITQKKIILSCLKRCLW